MKKLFGALLLISVSCGGKLSQDERQRLHEGMSTQDIKRVNDAELQEAAMAFSNAVIRDVEKVDRFLLQESRIDSMEAARGVRIYSITPDNTALKEIEQKLIEAYIAGTNAGTAGDNLQGIGEDSLLFTRPMFSLHPDGSQQFSHAIGIRMSKRTIILSIPQP